MTIKTKWIGVDGHGYNISIYIYNCGSHIMNSAQLELIPPISRKHTCCAHRSKRQRAPMHLRTSCDVPTVQDSLPIQDPTPAKGCWLNSVAMITGEDIDTYKRYGRALGSSPLRGQHNSKQNYFPVVYFFRTATKPLTCIVQKPGHLGHRTVEQCIAQVSGEPQCLTRMSWQCLPAWPRGAPALEP